MTAHNRNSARRRALWGLLAPLVLALASAALLAGCGGTAGSAFREGRDASQKEMWDRAVLSFAKAVAQDPGNARYRLYLERAKLKASTGHFDRAKRYLQSAQVEMALKELQETVVLDPGNQYAASELAKLQAELDRRRNQPSEFDESQSEAEKQAALLAPPKLDPTSNIPISLRFPDNTVNEVYEAVSKTSGINFLYDDKVDLKKKVTLDLASVTFEQAMDILMLMNKHFYKVINAHTILIADDNRPKHQEYDDQVIRTFYLSNAETQDITQLIRALLETRRVADNKNLNAITIKDTPERMKVAERIIKANDKAKGEVLVDIELLEINRDKAITIGLDLTSKTMAVVFGDTTQDASGNYKSGFVPLSQLNVLRQKGAWSVGPIPGVTLDFMRSDSDTRQIARPQIRILEGDTGKIDIGERVPVPATSFNTSQTIGGNIVPVTSFQYQNVGVRVEIKPRVHHNKEVTLDLKTEVSAVTNYVSVSGSAPQPVIGQRVVETTIRLQDGETSLLAGLIKDDERNSLTGVPGLTDIPILRRLFGRTDADVKSSDIVLSITPHIVRVPSVEPIDLVPLWVGTEDRVELRGVARNALGESPFGPGTSPWESIDKELKGEKTKGGASQATPGAKPADKTAAPKTSTVRATSGAPTPAPPPTPTPASEPAPVEEAPTPEGGGAPAPETPPEEQPPAPVVQVRLAPERAQVAAGEALGVDVLISDAVNVSTVNFQLQYDPSVLRFAPPAVGGEFLRQGGASVDLQAVESAEGGLIVVSAARSGATGAAGSGRLVRLNFVALAEGSAGFSFVAAQVRGPDNQPQAMSLRASDVDVTP